jgi:hypothetical protein
MRRRSTGKRIELTDRDIEIFRVLDRYRFLRSTYLHAFVGGKSETRFKERLGDLYHEGGYLDRPEVQWRLVDSRYKPIVYELTRRGRQALDRQGAVPDRMPLFHRVDLGGCRQFPHAVMVSEIIASFELGARPNPNLRFISWEEILQRAPEETRALRIPFALPTRVRFMFPASAKQECIDTVAIPDAMFGLEYRHGGRRQYRFFALEADCGTMPIERSTLGQSSLLRKVCAYREVVSSQLHRTQLGLPNLLILIVTSSQPRLQAIQQLIKRVTGGSKLFLSTTTRATGESEPHMPLSSLLTEPWLRAGFDAVQLDQPEWSAAPPIA